MTDVSSQSILFDKDKMEAVSVIVGTIAHDFNNLLMPLLAYPELIKSDLPEGSSGRELLDVIEKTSKDMVHITEQLLNLSAKENGSAKDPVDVNSLVSIVLSQLKDKGLIPDGVTVRTTLEPAIGRVCGVPDHQEPGIIGGQDTVDRVKDIVRDPARFIRDNEDIFGVKTLKFLTGIFWGGKSHSQPVIIEAELLGQAFTLQRDFCPLVTGTDLPPENSRNLAGCGCGREDNTVRMSVKEPQGRTRRYERFTGGMCGFYDCRLIIPYGFEDLDLPLPETMAEDLPDPEGRVKEVPERGGHEAPPLL